MIVIVNPPNPEHAVSNKDTMGGLGQLYAEGSLIKIPPIDIAYCAALLRKNNLALNLIDCLGDSLDLKGLISRLNQIKPEFVALRTSTPTFDCDMQITQEIKRQLGCKVIIFGPHVTIFPEEAIKNEFVDALILGEPEYSLLEIVGKNGFSGCRGVWYKDKEAIIRNDPRDRTTDLDGLPFPAWDLMPYRSYEAGELMNNIKPFVTALTSRGCPHACLYCPYPVAQGRDLRARSPENVVAELEWLTRDLGVKAVLFRDPEFALKKDRAVDICNLILSRALKIAWRCETRLEDLDEALIRLMAKSGCIGINIGIESADKEVLQNTGRKPVPLKKARKIINSCRKNNIGAFCFFIIGLPKDNKRTVRKTIDYALGLDPEFVQFTVATPYPGTALLKWAIEHSYIEDQSLSCLTGYAAAMRNENLTCRQIDWLRWFANEAMDTRAAVALKRLRMGRTSIFTEFKRGIRFHLAELFGN
ncbi:MAG: radical SAM protein [Candidatus Omnitrophica bacterium]|nr:radical SAM protein [Candidatus Omnitrophota bacterium]